MKTVSTILILICALGLATFLICGALPVDLNVLGWGWCFEPSPWVMGFLRETASKGMSVFFVTFFPSLFSGIVTSQIGEGWGP